MREILFRGKRQDNGEWIEGCLLRVYERVCRGVYQPREYAIQSVEEWIAPHFVVAETVGEYTGLTDKNGKKIFEGDILSDGDDTYKVVFDEGVFRIENSHYTTGVYVAIYIDKINKVIGNVYDNPELLEVEK